MKLRQSLYDCHSRCISPKPVVHSAPAGAALSRSVSFTRSTTLTRRIALSMWEQQPHSRSETQADPRIYVLVAAAVAVVFLVDVWTIIGVVTWIFYLIPLSLCLFGTRPGAPLLVALVSSALIVADYFVSPPGVEPWISQVNRTFGVFTLWVVALQLRWLIASRLQLRHQAWLRNAQALMAERVRGEGSMEEMCARVLELLTSYIDAQVGAVFVRDGERLDCV